MPAMALAIGGSAVAGAGGSIFSSLMGASGASKSAAAIRYAADQASKEPRPSRRGFCKPRGKLPPLRYGLPFIPALLGGAFWQAFVKPRLNSMPVLGRIYNPFVTSACNRAE
jgi:hypothetical protein